MAEEDRQEDAGAVLHVCNSPGSKLSPRINVLKPLYLGGRLDLASPQLLGLGLLPCASTGKGLRDRKAWEAQQEGQSGHQNPALLCRAYFSPLFWDRLTD